MSIASRRDLNETELARLNSQVLPILYTTLPAEFVSRSLAAITDGIEQNVEKNSAEFMGMLPEGGVGISGWSPRDYNQATDWSVRKNHASTLWQTLHDSVTLSKYTHIVVLGYEDLENVIRLLAVKETITGSAQPIVDLKELKKKPDQVQPVEPFIFGPIATLLTEVFVEAIGYSDFRPFAFTVAPHPYLISKTFIA